MKTVTQTAVYTRSRRRVHKRMDLLADYFAWLRAGNVSPGTIRLRRHYLLSLQLSHPGQSLLDLDADDLTGFLSPPAWAAETRKSARGSLRSFYGWAHGEGFLAHNPAARLRTVRVPPGRPRPAPDDVFERALIAAINPREHLMVTLAAYAGLRRGEIARVHTNDVIADSLRVVGKGGTVRIVPLHPALLAILEAMADGYAFPGRTDGHLSPDYVGKILGRLLGPNWSGHTLRHRFASRAYLVERDLRAVQTLLGHSKPETTMRYTAVPDGALRAAVMGTVA